MASETQERHVKSHCNRCGGSTFHFVKATNEETEEVEGATLFHFTEFMQCDGCQDPSIRITTTAGNDPGYSHTHYIPPRWKRSKPSWLINLLGIDPGLHGLMHETYLAAQNGSYRLAAMGIRAAMDHVMNRVVGDIGGFSQKLDAMVTAGKMSSDQRESFAVVIDSGSAAIHRGAKPTWETLEPMLTLTEYFVNHTYITGPMIRATKANIPPRPKSPA